MMASLYLPASLGQRNEPSTNRVEASSIANHGQHPTLYCRILWAHLQLIEHLRLRLTMMTVPVSRERSIVVMVKYPCHASTFVNGGHQHPQNSSLGSTENGRLLTSRLHLPTHRA